VAGGLRIVAGGLRIVAGGLRIVAGGREWAETSGGRAACGIIPRILFDFRAGAGILELSRETHHHHHKQGYDYDDCNRKHGQDGRDGQAV
jgi:hypothetical protein